MSTKTKKKLTCFATQGWVDPLGLQEAEECPLLPEISPLPRGAGTFPLPPGAGTFPHPPAKEIFVALLLQASPPPPSPMNPLHHP